MRRYYENSNENYQNNYFNNNKPLKTIKEMQVLLLKHRNQINTYMQYLDQYANYFSNKNTSKHIINQFDTIRDESLGYNNIDKKLNEYFHRAESLIKTYNEVNKEPIGLTEESILKSINEIDTLIIEQRMGYHDDFGDYVKAHIERFKTNINNFIEQSNDDQQLSNVAKKLEELIAFRRKDFHPREISCFYTYDLKNIIKDINGKIYRNNCRRKNNFIDAGNNIFSIRRKPVNAGNNRSNIGRKPVNAGNNKSNIRRNLVNVDDNIFNIRSNLINKDDNIFKK